MSVRVPDSSPGAATSTSLHATSVAFDNRAVVISGPSDSGKSALALELIGLGAVLIADDLTRLRRENGQVVALAPPRLRGVIEARGVGLLHTPYCERANVCLVVDMSRVECERLPHNHVTDLLGVATETIYKVEATHFAVAIRLLVTGGRYA